MRHACSPQLRKCESRPPTPPPSPRSRSPGHRQARGWSPWPTCSPARCRAGQTFRYLCTHADREGGPLDSAPHPAGTTAPKPACRLSGSKATRAPQQYAASVPSAMAQVWCAPPPVKPPADTAAQPEVTVAGTSTGTGMVTVAVVLPSEMPSWPDVPLPAHARGPGERAVGTAHPSPRAPRLQSLPADYRDPKHCAHPSSTRHACPRRWRRCGMGPPTPPPSRRSRPRWRQPARGWSPSTTCCPARCRETQRHYTLRKQMGT